MANAYNLNTVANDNPDAEGATEATPEFILTAFMAMDNMVPSLDPAKLPGIAQVVVEEYAIDKQSRDEWEKRIDLGMKLAMLTSEVKTYPWPGAANVKYPLLTVAALQFNARAYPAIVQGNRVVKCSTWGRDPQGKKAARGDRVSEFMSYQLLGQMPEWEEDLDRLLVILPIVGSCFKKIYYDPSLKRNTTRLVTADRFVVNYWARSLDDVPRVTEEMRLYPYEIEERIRSGRFVDFSYDTVTADQSGDKKAASQQDKDAPHLFLEQHRLLDLDEDGYAEPYIVTVHASTQQVCRIVANFAAATIKFAQDGKVSAVRKQQYYVHYQFMPSPDGSFYGLGFGWLTKDIGEAINSLNNMMIDMGHLATVQGGIVSAQLGIKEKAITLKPGEWRVVNSSVPMNQAVFPVNYPGPSAALFQLLQMLIEAGRDITGVKDVLTGEGMGKNASPTTTMALIEQGLQQFTAIYKRVHRSLKTEYGILAQLNRKWVDPQTYAEFFDEPEAAGIGHNGGPPLDPNAPPQQAVGAPQPGPDMQAQPMGAPTPAPMQQAGPPDPKADFNEDDMDILPISDPAMVSKMQKLAQAEFLYQTSKENPALDQAEATTRYLEAAGVEDVDELVKPPPPSDPAVVELTKRGAEAEVADQENDAKLKDAQTQLALAQAETLRSKTEADIGLTAAKTESEGVKAEQAAIGAMSDHAAANAVPTEDPKIQIERDRHQKAHELATKVHDDSMALEERKRKDTREIAMASARLKAKPKADGAAEPDLIDKNDEANAAIIDAIKGLADTQKGVVDAVAALQAQASAPKEIKIVKDKAGKVSGATVTQ